MSDNPVGNKFARIQEISQMLREAPPVVRLAWKERRDCVGIQFFPKEVRVPFWEFCPIDIGPGWYSKHKTPIGKDATAMDAFYMCTVYWLPICGPNGKPLEMETRATDDATVGNDPDFFV